jgi:secernin
MCDTFIVLSALAASGRTTLAKNSDREPNEAQYLTQTQAEDHAEGSMLRCTYVEIPQVGHTYAVVGSRPWWMWGFEHGVNEKGLAVGNEAVWARLPGNLEPGLLGMDLLRLTLERAATADEALTVLTGLLETYGQSGRTSAVRESTYHNSFILADFNGGWIVQTVARHWVAKRIKGWASISNVYSIGSDYDLISVDAIDFAVESGWHDPASGIPFNFAAVFADMTLPNLPSCQARFALSQAGLNTLEKSGSITLEEMFALLRSHGAGDGDPEWRPGVDGESVLCMHAKSPEGFETAASMVVEMPRLGATSEPLLYWASLGSPCLSSFVPVWSDAYVPTEWMQPAETAGDAWWSQETAQRLIERDYAGLAKAPRAIYAEVERQAIAAVKELASDAGTVARAELTKDLLRRQRAARDLVASMTETCACEIVTLRSPDLRGDYLVRVNATRPQTFRASGV